MPWGGLLLSLAAGCAAATPVVPRAPVAAPPPRLINAAACTAPQPNACVEEGHRRSEGGAPAEAVPLYGGACARGDARGCDWLGERLRDGHGTERDLRGALFAFERGCDLGRMSACQALGSMHANGCAGDGTETGRGLPVDLARSFQFHKRACDGGLADGCMSVGYMYEHGEHVAVDVARAIALYERACYVGAGDACYALSLLFAAGKGVAMDTKRAQALVEQGCRAHGAFACFAMAQQMYDGESNVKGACCTAGLLLRACAGHHRQACQAVGILCGAEPKDVVERYQAECKDAPLIGCEFIRGDRY